MIFAGLIYAIIHVMVFLYVCRRVFANKRLPIYGRSGFTLTELLIVVSIFTVMTALLVANYRRFGSNVTLANTAYEVAQSIREVQTYGLSSRATGAGSGANDSSVFRKRYGFYMGSATQYVLFVDTNDNNVYDGVSTDQVLKTFTLPNDMTFAGRCVAGGVDGGIPNTPQSNTPIHMTFFRPNPDATIKRNSGSTVYARARICLTSASSGKSKEIAVFGSGQIEVTDVTSCVCS